MELTFENFNQEHAAFTTKAFPTITDYRAPLKHLLEEVEEAMQGGEPEEYADCLMLLLSSFRLRYPHRNTHDLLQAAAAKLEINKQRKWKMNDEGFAGHVEDESHPDFQANRKLVLEAHELKRTLSDVNRILNSGLEVHPDSPIHGHIKKLMSAFL